MAALNCPVPGKDLPGRADLPPLAAGGYVDLVDSLINPQDETSRPGGGQQPAEAAPAGPAALAPGPPPVAGTQAEDPQDDVVSTGIVDLPAPRIIERTDPLAFSGDEQRLLHLLGPPLIATLRAAKRLANSYGLLSALHSADLASRQDGDQPGYRAAMVLLATLVGYPELGPGPVPPHPPARSRRTLRSMVLAGTRPATPARR